MTTEEFVCAFRVQMDEMLQDYAAHPPSTAVGTLIQSMVLTPEQSATMRRVLDHALTDAFYSILLGLDGCARIGDAMQRDFRIEDKDDDSVITLGGDIEPLAYKHFQQGRDGGGGVLDRSIE